MLPLSALSLGGAGLDGAGMDIATGLVGVIGLMLIIAGAASIMVHRRRFRSFPGGRHDRVHHGHRVPGRQPRA